jgi:hypothetical protein
MVYKEKISNGTLNNSIMKEALLKGLSDDLLVKAFGICYQTSKTYCLEYSPYENLNYVREEFFDIDDDGSLESVGICDRCYRGFKLESEIYSNISRSILNI